MPPDFPWFYATLVLAAVGWFVPKALNQIKRFLAWLMRVFGHVAARAIVAALEEQLAPSWAADFDDALEEALKPIKDELTTNGGASLKDKVDVTALSVKQIQRDIEPLLSEYKRRYDPPSGTPA